MNQQQIRSARQVIECARDVAVQKAGQIADLTTRRTTVVASKAADAATEQLTTTVVAAAARMRGAVQKFEDAVTAAFEVVARSVDAVLDQATAAPSSRGVPGPPTTAGTVNPLETEPADRSTPTEARPRRWTPALTELRLVFKAAANPPDPASRAAGAAAFSTQGAATGYDARPPYHEAALERMLRTAVDATGTSGRALRVLDVGTGNGLLISNTQAVAHRLGIAVRFVGLDMSGPMLAQLKGRHPEIAVIRASMNAVPAMDGKFDLVMAGSSLHWGDPVRTPAELHRVLGPDGVVARIDSITGPSGLTDILMRMPGHAIQVNPMTQHDDRVELGPAFASEPGVSFRTGRPMTSEQLAGFLRTVHLFYVAPPDDAQDALDALEEWAERHAVDGEVTVPFVTRLAMARKLPKPV